MLSLNCRRRSVGSPSCETRTFSENKFYVLPEAVTNMAGLIEPRVTDNRLTSLPGSISKPDAASGILHTEQ